jgi:dephospho-CoA kinase
MKKFIQRDERELGWGIGEVIAMADLMIINEGSIDEFREKVEEILLKL